MVVDTLDNLARYRALNPHFDTAFAYLGRDDLDRLPEGRHEVDGDRVFAIVSHLPGKGHAQAPREAHRRYLDIQLCLHGTDEIGYRPYATCDHVVQAYAAETEVELFADDPDSWVQLPPGRFAILWPQDMHAPLGAPVGTPLHKLVLKVRVD